MPNLVEGLSRSALYQKEQALWSPLGSKSFLSFQFNDWFTPADDSFVCLELAGDWTPLLELVLKAFVRALVQAGERMPRERVWSFSRILSKTFFPLQADRLSKLLTTCCVLEWRGRYWVVAMVTVEVRTYAKTPLADGYCREQWAGAPQDALRPSATLCLLVWRNSRTGSISTLEVMCWTL